MRFWLLLAPALLYAQDWGSLHIVNADVPLSRKWTLQIHSRVRTNENFSDYFQFRTGPILYYQAAKRLTLIGGSYFTNEKNAQDKLATFGRVFGGATVLVPSPRSIKWEARTLLEDFFATPRGTILRARERFWFTFGTKSLRPYVHVEGLVQEGNWNARIGVGAQKMLGKGRELFMGYEYRQLPNGTTLHLLATNYTFKLRKRPD